MTPNIMTEHHLALIALLAPLVFLFVAFISSFEIKHRKSYIKKASMLSTYLSVAIAIASCFLVYKYNVLETNLLGVHGLGFSLRLDAVSVLMFTMISLLSLVIVKFSINYLDGDKRQDVFLGRLTATFAAVQFLVLSGNLVILLLSWILASVFLHNLLIFYPNRIAAIVAARKKFILARLGDISLLIATIFLYNQFGTGNLELIFQEIKLYSYTDMTNHKVEFAAVFLALAAVLKSAQFPTHGWLIEVMETPTPVSALLHAGLLNAGPFLIVRMAFVMDASTLGSFGLIAIGGFTALFASVVYLTQSSIKTALGYSSVAHMGFSLMVCGLGIFPAAMLHLVAHSFYKAHAFLASGSIIDQVRAAKTQTPKNIGNPIRIVIGLFLAIILYGTFAYIWGIHPKEELSLLAIGAIITMGITRIFVSAIDTSFSVIILLRTSFLALLVVTSFFILEALSHFILSSQIPKLRILNIYEIILLSIILIAFGVAVFIQLYAPKIMKNTKTRTLSIHLKNGLYANAYFDKLIATLDLNTIKKTTDD